MGTQNTLERVAKTKFRNPDLAQLAIGIWSFLMTMLFNMPIAYAAVNPLNGGYSLEKIVIKDVLTLDYSSRRLKRGHFGAGWFATYGAPQNPAKFISSDERMDKVVVKGTTVRVLWNVDGTLITGLEEVSPSSKKPHKFQMIYDEWERLISITDSGKVIANYSYDDLDNLLRAEDSQKGLEEVTYDDALDTVKSIQSFDGCKDTFQYQIHGLPGVDKVPPSFDTLVDSQCPNQPKERLRLRFNPRSGGWEVRYQ